MKTIALTAVLIVGCAGVRDQSVTQQLCTAGTGCCPGSPIIVDMAGDGIHLTSPTDGVVFQLRAGRFGLWAWTERGSDDSFLVLDVNGNGRIDDGSELFGDGATQVASADPNGFMALAYYDTPEQGGNYDGVIDARDAVWSRLRLWRDADHDAFSAPSELATLDAAGVHSFSLAATPSTRTDVYGNEFRFSSTIVADPPVSSTVSDVWLRQLPVPVEETGGRVLRDYVQWTCWAWVYATQYANSTGDVEVACDSPYVANDPYATVNGRLTRLVARYSVSTSYSTARSRAGNIIADAVIMGSHCHWHEFPNPDTYYSEPYDVVGSEFLERVKCFDQLIQTNDGGGGC